MKTEHELRTQYGDVVEGDDESATVELLRTLDVAYHVGEPPARFIAETRALLRERSTSHPHVRFMVAWGRLVRERPLLGLLTTMLAILIVTVTVAYAATSVIHVFPPEQRPTQDVVFISNDLPPQSYQRYRALDPARAARESGLPVAYLNQIPATLHGNVGVQLFEPTPWPVEQTTMPEQFRSVVRYRGSHTLILALFELAPRVVEKHPVLLGEHTVQLPNGQDAWATTEPQMVESHWVSLVQDGYVVSLYSDLPLADVERLATAVTVAPPSGPISKRRIPANWPTPLPADTPIPGVDIAVIGTVGRVLSSHPPRLTYVLKIGNRGTGHEQHLALTLVLPLGLTFAGDTPGREHTIPFGSGNGGIGGDLPLNVTDPTAFDRGIDIRVTWTSNGVKGERTFHLPFSSSPIGLSR